MGGGPPAGRRRRVGSRRAGWGRWEFCFKIFYPAPIHAMNRNHQPNILV